MITVLIEASDKESFEYAVEKAIKDGHTPLWETFRVNDVISKLSVTLRYYYIFMKKE